MVKKHKPSPKKKGKVYGGKKAPSKLPVQPEMVVRDIMERVSINDKTSFGAKKPRMPKLSSRRGLMRKPALLALPLHNGSTSS